MAPEAINSTAVLVTAIGSAIAAIGAVVVPILVMLQQRKLREIAHQGKEIAHQGNSVALELHRVNAVFAKRLAIATKDVGDEAIAADAEAVYLAAKAQAELAKK